jgi:hypothetical protein
VNSASTCSMVVLVLVQAAGNLGVLPLISHSGVSAACSGHATFSASPSHRQRWSLDRLELRDQDSYGLRGDLDRRDDLPIDLIEQPFSERLEVVEVSLMTGRAVEQASSSAAHADERLDLATAQPSDGLRRASCAVKQTDGRRVARHRAQLARREGATCRSQAHSTVDNRTRCPDFPLLTMQR